MVETSNDAKAGDPLLRLVSELDASRLPAPHDCRAIRKAVGATQSQFGEVVGVTGQTISLWESGKRRPRGEQRRRYAELLDHLAGLAS